MSQENEAIVVPAELIEIMEADIEAKDFFYSLAESYKKGYCDWVGGAKQLATRQNRASKALIMLQNKQKTLKT